jgi:NAD(P)-dependent dehydrogenase (short-subunit alcohol dehydrogenase family)
VLGDVGPHSSTLERCLIVDDRGASMRDGQRLNAKVAVVTGASRPIGSAVARAFAKSGATLVVTAPTDGELKAVIRNLRGVGVRVHPSSCVMTDDDQIAGALASMANALGQLDILVVIPGASRFNAPYLAIGSTDVANIAEMSPVSVARACNDVSRYMAAAAGGSVIIFTNPVSIRPWPDMSALAVRLALIELTKALALQWATDGVRINVITPGGVGANLSFRAGMEGDVADSAEPVRQCGSLNDLTDAVIWLASNDSVTGIHIPLDGGLYTEVADEWRHLVSATLVSWSSSNCPVPIGGLRPARS